MTRLFCAAAFALLALSAPAAAATRHGDQFLGEVKALPYDFCPEEWAPAEGQLLPIGHYTALFSLLGTRYGGDGKTTFALPDLTALTSKSRHSNTVAEVHWCIAIQGMWPPRN